MFTNSKVISLSTFLFLRILINLGPVFAYNICLTTAASDSKNPAIATTNEGTSYIAWQENIDGNWEILLCRTDYNGNKNETFGIINISNTSTSSEYPDISVDSNGHSYIVWQESDSIYFSMVTPGGDRVVDKKIIDTGNCSNPRISTTNTGDSNIVYEKRQITIYKVLYSKINHEGTSLINSKVISDLDIIGIVPKYPSIITGNDGYSYILWRDYYNWSYGAYYTSLKPDGTVDNSVKFMDGEMVSKPQMALSTEQGYIYLQYKEGSNYGVYTFYNGGLIKIDNGEKDSTNPTAASDENDNVYIAWQDNRSGSWDIYLAQLGVDRHRVRDEIAITNTNSDSREPDITVVNGIWYLVWQNNSSGNRQIYFSRKDCDCSTIHSVDSTWVNLTGILGNEAIAHFGDHKNEAVYSLISGNPQIMENANPCGAVIDLNGNYAITHLLDNEWSDRLDFDYSFNTVYDCDPKATGVDSECNPGGVFEVVSCPDVFGPSTSCNPNEYYFSYDGLNDTKGQAITIEQWINYLKEIRDRYGRIGRLTIFCHGNFNEIDFSDNFILHYSNPNILSGNNNLVDAFTINQISRLKNEQILTDNAVILFFVCRVGGNVKGENLIQEIANLTGATVYANSEFTGDPWPGYSDWALDIVKSPADLGSVDFAFKTLNETSAFAENPDSVNHDNDWKDNEDEDLAHSNPAYVTHVLYPYPEYDLEFGDYYTGTPGVNPYAKPSPNYSIPLILIHGLQSDEGLTDPAKLIEYTYSAENYWKEFIDYFESTPKLNQRYRLYLYKYPSYKHITYNARILKELINKIDYLKGRKVIILAHSMGGLVARTLIEEHGFQDSTGSYNPGHTSSWISRIHEKLG